MPVTHVDRVRVSIEDDSGIDADLPGLGMGLTGMRARMSAFSGTVDAGAGAGGGFRVNIDIPLSLQQVVPN